MIQKLRRFAGILLVLLMIPAVCLADMAAYFVDNGTDHFIAVIADGKTMVMENGGDNSGDALLSWLGQAQAGKIDLWVGQGTGAAQGDAILKVLTSIQIQTAWLPEDGSGNSAYGDVHLVLQNQGAQIVAPAAGTKYDLGNAHITVLAANESGLALRIDYGANSFLLSNSMDVFNDPSLAETKSLTADVLNLYTGSVNSAVSQDSLAAVSPVFSIVGGSNAQPVMDQLSAGGFAVLEVKTDGIPTLTSDGTFLRFTHAQAYGITIKNKVNIRSSASTNAKKIATLSKNTAVVITGFTVNQDGEKWYVIDLGENTGYVRSDLLAPVTGAQLKQYQTANPKAVKTPKPTVDAVSGGTKKKH